MPWVRGMALAAQAWPGGSVPHVPDRRTPPVDHRERRPVMTTTLHMSQLGANSFMPLCQLCAWHGEVDTLARAYTAFLNHYRGEHA